uniref:Uncharacterized protein n=1 Tax=Rhizophora mucronata TaxID=61149 RepID=A0A2P2J2X8_RHIMU
MKFLIAIVCQSLMVIFVFAIGCLGPYKVFCNCILSCI